MQSLIGHCRPALLATVHRSFATTTFNLSESKSSNSLGPKEGEHYPNTPEGLKERTVRPDGLPEKPLQTPYPPFPGNKNPKTGELSGPTGPEPTRYGDWERKGRVTDF